MDHEHCSTFCLGGVIGIILISNLLALALYGAKCASDEDKFGDTSDPNSYSYDILISCRAIMFFGSLGAACSLIAIFVGSFFIDDNPCFIFAFCFISVFATFANSVTLGSYYDHSLNGMSLPENSIRNVSSASKYIRNSIKLLYEEAVRSFEQMPNSSFCPMDSWEDALRKVGDYYEIGSSSYYYYYGKRYFTWADFFNPTDFNETIFFRKKTLPENGATLIEAVLNCNDEYYSVPVASLSFNFSKPTSFYGKEYFCTNKSNFNIKCNLVRDLTKSKISDGISDFSSYYRVTQNIIKWPNGRIRYYSESDKIYYDVVVDYQVTFPSAFRIISYKEYIEAQNNLEYGNYDAFYYDKPTSYYRVNPTKFLKKLIKNEKNNLQRKGYLYGDEFYFCPKGIPKYSSYSERDRCTEEKLNTDFLVEYYPESLDYNNSGYIPPFVKSYKDKLSRKEIFSVNDDALPQMAIILMCFQLVASVFGFIMSIVFICPSC